MAIEGGVSVLNPEEFKLLKGDLPLDGDHAKVHLDDDNGHVTFEVKKDLVHMFGYSAYGTGKVTIIDRLLLPGNENTIEILIRAGQSLIIDRPDYSLELRNTAEIPEFEPSTERVEVLSWLRKRGLL